VTPQVTDQVGRLLVVVQGEMSRTEIQAALGLKDRMYLREAYLVPALASALLEMTIPNAPNSRLQKYRLTPTGRKWLAVHGKARGPDNGGNH
jgi:ATP-dependent DNA helicase RecG